MIYSYAFICKVVFICHYLYISDLSLPSILYLLKYLNFLQFDLSEPYSTWSQMASSTNQKAMTAGIPSDGWEGYPRRKPNIYEVNVCVIGLSTEMNELWRSFYQTGNPREEPTSDGDYLCYRNIYGLNRTLSEFTIEDEHWRRCITVPKPFTNEVTVCCILEYMWYWETWWHMMKYV